MKPKQTITLSIRRQRGLRSSVVAALAAFGLAGFAPAEVPHKKLPPVEPCVVTARFVCAATINEARADYNLAFANANNAATTPERTAGRKQAAADYKEAVALARAQYRARRELCEALDEERYNPVIVPADFLTVAQTAAAPNRFFPLVPGTTFNYRAETPEGTETISFEVTRNTRTILGVTTLVVRDIVKLNGSVIEDTVDWFAQDRSGNVWYFGENTAEYQDGLITTTAGSWEAGVAGAKAGIIMFASPVVGTVYRQELFLGEAEDAAEVVALNESVSVPAGSYSGCLKTQDFTPIDPEVLEFKFYAPGIGSVLTVDPESGKRSELVSVQRN